MKKHLLMCLLVVMFAGILSGCGKGALGNGQGGQASSDGSVIVGITNDMDSLDPHKAVAAGTLEVLTNVFDGLLKVDPDGRMQPAIAESYSMTDDAKKITFVLRDDVYFHNGDKVTAEDVIYSLKRVAGMLDDSKETVKVIPAFSIISDITSHENEEGKTVIEVSLREANTELIYYFNTAVIPKGYTEMESKPVGTGPFEFVSYSPMESIVLKKNENYYGEQAHIPMVTFKIYGSTDDAFMELMAGKIHIYPYLSADEAAQLEGVMDVVSGEQSLVQALFLNNEEGPLKDKRVRQAINMAVNREEINSIMSGGYSTEIETGMFPSFREYYNRSTSDVYEYDVESAKKLLAEAGYENGFELEITIPGNYQFHISTGEIIVSQLQKIGIDAVIRQVDWSAWLEKVYTDRDYQATIIGLDATMAPGDVLARYQSDHNRNFVNYFSDDYDLFYKTALESSDENVKKEYYGKCQELLTEDAVSAYIMAPALTVAVNKSLKGYTFYPVYFMDMSKVYWEN